MHVVVHHGYSRPRMLSQGVWWRGGSFQDPHPLPAHLVQPDPSTHLRLRQ